MYHINPQTKAVGNCSATQGNCPFGGGENHFQNETDARRESERRLSEEYGQPKLTKEPKLIDSAQVRAVSNPAEKLGTGEKVAFGYYAQVFPVQHGELARYAYDKGLSLEEAFTMVEIMNRYKNPLAGGPSVLATRALQQRVKEAQDNCQKLDETLKASNFFSTIRTRGTSDGGASITAYATIGNDDYITHMRDNGEVVFEVYDHVEGESYRANQPSSFVDDGSGAINTWIANYNAYREHLWSRTLWDKERRAREARAGSLNL